MRCEEVMAKDVLAVAAPRLDRCDIRVRRQWLVVGAPMTGQFQRRLQNARRAEIRRSFCHHEGGAARARSSCS
jgi:hypothetical protein